MYYITVSDMARSQCKIHCRCTITIIIPLVKYTRTPSDTHTHAHPYTQTHTHAHSHTHTQHYLSRSCALTVPSKEQESTALPAPLPTNRIPYTVKAVRYLRDEVVIIMMIVVVGIFMVIVVMYMRECIFEFPHLSMHVYE